MLERSALEMTTPSSTGAFGRVFFGDVRIVIPTFFIKEGESKEKKGNKFKVEEKPVGAELISP
jgi:hypothetical protein